MSTDRRWNDSQSNIKLLNLSVEEARVGQRNKNLYLSLCIWEEGGLKVGRRHGGGGFGLGHLLIPTVSSLNFTTKLLVAIWTCSALIFLHKMCNVQQNVFYCVSVIILFPGTHWMGTAKARGKRDSLHWTMIHFHPASKVKLLCTLQVFFKQKSATM